MAAPPTSPPSVPDYRKLAAMLAELGVRAAVMGRDRGDQDLEQLALRLHGYARAIQRDLSVQWAIQQGVIQQGVIPHGVPQGLDAPSSDGR